MPNKKPAPKSTALVRSKRPDTSLQPLPQDYKTRRARARLSKARKTFLAAYEANFGNITVACKFAGITRTTFYRWMRSDSKVNLLFRRKLRGLYTNEALIDAAETVIVDKLVEGDAKVARFVLESKGRARGWNKDIPLETEEQRAVSEELERLRTAISKRAAEKGIEFSDELAGFLERFGEKLKPELRASLSSELASGGSA